MRSVRILAKCLIGYRTYTSPLLGFCLEEIRRNPQKSAEIPYQYAETPKQIHPYQYTEIPKQKHPKQRPQAKTVFLRISAGFQTAPAVRNT